jgi:UDPglucose 6-dehydrogenase
LEENNRVCVIGTWHLGCVVSACLADLGYSVVGMDWDAKTVKDLNKGVPPLFEPGLADLISTNIKSGKLRYTADLGQAVSHSRYVLITFDTPVDENDEVDLSVILNTAVALSKHLEDGSLVIVCSQVPIGTCEHIESLIRENNPAIHFDIACSPENLRLGQAIQRFENPDRIVIGADSKSALDKAEALFSVIKAPRLRMNLRSAEMAKHAINCFLATSISFISEISCLCEASGADALKVADALRSDERIGTGLPLRPGLGFSGGTLARDLKALKKLGKKSKCETTLIDGVWQVNQQQMRLVSRKLRKINGSFPDITVGVLGLTYKAGTSTLRRSAALEIIGDLVSQGATVKAYDPRVSRKELRSHREFKFCKNPYDVAKDSDALVIVTEWPEFKSLDFGAIKSVMRRPVIIDTKNMLDVKQMLEHKFQYLGVGRESK